LSTRGSPSTGSRNRVKKMVNNPWGNKGRRKCNACRSRKRSCTFEDEREACRFCAAAGWKCGPKVLAEKARHHRPKSVEDGSEPVMRTSLFNSSDSVLVTDDDRIEFSGDLIGFSDADYTPPTAYTTPANAKKRPGVKPVVSSRFKIAKVKSDQAFNLSSPPSQPSESKTTSYFDFRPSLDHQPSYVTTPEPSDPVGDELLPLYTDYCDNEDELNDNDRLDFLTFEQYTPDESCSSFNTILCIQQYA